MPTPILNRVKIYKKIIIDMLNNLSVLFSKTTIYINIYPIQNLQLIFKFENKSFAADTSQNSDLKSMNMNASMLKSALNFKP